MIALRTATNADSEAIKSVVFSVLTEYGLKSDSNATDKDLDNIEEHYFSNGGYFGVLEEHGMVIASVGLYKIDASTCELRKMYCLPSCRGRGLGKQLMEFSLAKARELGFKRVVLETATALKEAIGLYKKYGFVEYTADHLSQRCDQAYELKL